MDAEEFVEAIRIGVRDAAVEGTLDTLKRPPGRRPSEAPVQRAAWFNSLDKEQQRLLSEIVLQAVDSTIFGFLCVLDGVRVIENGSDKGIFELNYVRKGTIALNPPDGPMLHDLW